jgi:hypothetical protein
MMHKLPVTLMILATAFIGHAEILTPEAALQRATTPSRSQRVVAQTKQGTPKLVLTTSVEQEPTSYVFKYDTGGFVIVSADDATVPVLGYADDGEFDVNNLPPSLRAWLKHYGEEIAYARKNNIKAKDFERPARQNINPLLTTKWSQDSPYNSLCPNQYPAGCNAVALAQVMRYHRWPEKGEGSNSYTYESGQCNVDYSKTYYNWDNMNDRYDGTESKDKIDAVATLMYHCGTAMSTQYTKKNSTATLHEVAYAMINNFGYDDCLRDIMRRYYTTLEWEQIMYDQIQGCQPVIYCGYELNNSGHTFILDGYKGNGYFHINWGWGGLSNGYYRLDALDPTDQGTGGSTLGYNMKQEALVNIFAAREDTKPIPEMVTNGVFEITLSSDETLTEGDGFDKVQTAPRAGLKFVLTDFLYNRGLFPISGRFGLEFKHNEDDGSTTVLYLEGGKFTDLKRGSGYKQVTIRMSSTIPNGEYVVTPVWYDNDIEQWRNVRVPVEANTAYSFIVSDDQVIATPVDDYDIDVSDFRLETSLYNTEKFIVKADIVNRGSKEYIGELSLVLFDQYGKMVTTSADDEMIYVLGGTTEEFELVTKLSKIVDPGKYKLALYYKNFDLYIGDPIDIEVKRLENDPMYITYNVEFGGEDTSKVDKHAVPYSFTIACMQGYVLGNYVIYIWNEDKRTRAASITLPEIALEEEELRVISGSFDFENGVSGNKYYGTIYFIDGYATNEVYPFTLDPDQTDETNTNTGASGTISGSFDSSDNPGGTEIDPDDDPTNNSNINIDNPKDPDDPDPDDPDDSGVTTVSVDDGVVSVQYYNLQGIPVNNPTQGIFIKVEVHADGRHVSNKVILQ